ncbi:MAG: hypothetical protein Q7R77_04405 [Candidatus Daviesbacteria bacterium]|nr:hypothetical protein [Candidatus Daviesbacteria bacterium]
MDIVVEELIINKDRPEHIARHDIKEAEVRELTEGNYTYIQGKLGRWILIGKTKKGRVLAVVVGAREKKGVYGLVTARSANREERSFYDEFEKIAGGE